jgi:hypothetical protein
VASFEREVPTGLAPRMTVFSKIQWHILSAALSDGLREFAAFSLAPR